MLEILSFIKYIFPLIFMFVVGSFLGSYFTWRNFIKEKEELLNDIYWIGDKDGDNPEIEYEQ
jgi:hypothetical protein